MVMGPVGGCDCPGFGTVVRMLLSGVVRSFSGRRLGGSHVSTGISTVALAGRCRLYSNQWKDQSWHRGLKVWTRTTQNMAHGGK